MSNLWLDTIRAGTTANRPTAPDCAPNSVVLYLCTDTNRLDAYNPTTGWITDVAGSGGRDKPKQAIVTGAAAGDVTVTAIKLGDRLDAVLNLTDLTDLTSEFTITADGKINNTGGTSTATKKLEVRWTKLT